MRPAERLRGGLIGSCAVALFVALFMVEARGEWTALTLALASSSIRGLYAEQSIFILATARPHLAISDEHRNDSAGPLRRIPGCLLPAREALTLRPEDADCMRAAHTLRPQRNLPLCHRNVDRRPMHIRRPTASTEAATRPFSFGQGKSVLFAEHRFDEPEIASGNA
jgi:hypothetical protein